MLKKVHCIYRWMIRKGRRGRKEVEIKSQWEISLQQWTIAVGDVER